MPKLTIEILTGPPKTGKSTYAQQESTKEQNALRYTQLSDEVEKVLWLTNVADLPEFVDDFDEGHYGPRNVRIILDDPQVAAATVLVKEFIPNDNSRIDPDKLLSTLDEMTASDNAEKVVRGVAAELARSIRNGDFK